MFRLGRVDFDPWGPSGSTLAILVFEAGVSYGSIKKASIGLYRELGLGLLVYFNGVAAVGLVVDWGFGVLVGVPLSLGLRSDPRIVHTRWVLYEEYMNFV